MIDMHPASSVRSSMSNHSEELLAPVDSTTAVAVEYWQLAICRATSQIFSWTRSVKLKLYVLERRLQVKDGISFSFLVVHGYRVSYLSPDNTQATQKSERLLQTPVILFLHS